MKNPFLEIGDENAVLKNKVVMILNAESATLQKDTRNFIRKQNSDGNSVMPKRSLHQINSFVLTNAYGKDSLFSSSRSSKLISEN